MPIFLKARLLFKLLYVFLTRGVTTENKLGIYELLSPNWGSLSPFEATDLYIHPWENCPCNFITQTVYGPYIVDTYVQL